VLSDVDFEVHRGEVVALVGDNGAGKSTLVKIVSGIFPADAGRFHFDGADRHVSTPSDATALGIATVYQDLALCDNLDVVANLYLGREPLGPPPLVDETAMEREALVLLRQLSVSIPSVRTPVASLSGGQRQSVAVARATMGEPQLVILDEPTAALGVAQTRQVLDLVRRLADRGLGVVLISHNMNDVLEVADRIAALYLGRLAADVAASEVKHGQVVELITAGRSGDLGLAPAAIADSV
jgi:D-xylose transport system ATP-binding protein